MVLYTVLPAPPPGEVLRYAWQSPSCHTHTSNPLKSMEHEFHRSNLPSSTDFVDQLIDELSSFQPDLTRPGAAEPDPRTQSTQQPKAPPNALSGLSASELARVKPLLLTLHCLFPNDLLPALDILDRKLVQRIVVRGNKVNAVPSAPTQDQTTSPGDQKIPHDGTNTTLNQTTLDDTIEDSRDEDLFLFLVTSASSAPTHPIPATSSSLSSTTASTTPTTAPPHTTQEPHKVYEIRLDAWNCTCPTFTLSAFRDLDSRLASIPKPSSSPAEPPSNTNTARRRDRDQSTVYPFGGTLTCTTDRDSPPACKHILACVLFARCPRLFGGGGDASRGVLMEELAGWCAGWGG